MTKIVSNKETRIKRHTCELCSTNYVKKADGSLQRGVQRSCSLRRLPSYGEQSIVTQKSQW